MTNIAGFFESMRLVIKTLGADTCQIEALTPVSIRLMSDWYSTKLL